MTISDMNKSVFFFFQNQIFEIYIWKNFSMSKTTFGSLLQYIQCVLNNMKINILFEIDKFQVLRDGQSCLEKLCLKDNKNI